MGHGLSGAVLLLNSNMKIMIKAFLFDFGGVIVRTEDSSVRYAWDERLGLPHGSVERAVHHSDLWIQAQLGRVSEAAYWRGVAELLYMHGEDVEALRKDYFSGDRLNYRLIELIRELRAKDYPVGLLSNESLALESRLHALGIRDLFDHVFVSAQIGVMKPDTTAYRVALQALNVRPQDVLFVDDTLADVRAAQALGMRTILFRPETDLRAELATLMAADTEDR
jgi:epoxide hydrolase-like predicted phosphatase